MVTMEAILQEYINADILLFDHCYAAPAALIKVDGGFGVFIDPSCFKTEVEQKGALVHELGHGKTGTTHRVDSPHQLVYQHEHRAKKSSWLDWAPPEKFQTAFSLGLTTPWEIAEWIDLPEKFIIEAWTYYANNGLL